MKRYLQIKFTIININKNLFLIVLTRKINGLNALQFLQLEINQTVFTGVGPLLLLVHFQIDCALVVMVVKT